MAEKSKAKWIAEKIDWIRRAHWIWTLFPLGWKAFIVAAILGAISILLHSIHSADLGKAFLIAVIVVSIYGVAWMLIQTLRKISGRFAFQKSQHTGGFSLEFPHETHNYAPFEAFIRNCNTQNFARDIRFDPIESRQGLKLWIDQIASLGPGERKPLTFHTGENAEYRGVTGHIVNFFEGGSANTDQPTYELTIHFLDGNRQATESHSLEGHPMPRGGVELKIYPAIAESSKELPLKTRAMQVANDLLALLQKQGPKPPNPLSAKGSEHEQRRAFDAYFDWIKDTYFKYMAYHRDRVVKIDFELAANRFFTKLETREINPPPTSNDVDVKKIAEAILLTASHMPDSK